MLTDISLSCEVLMTGGTGRSPHRRLPGTPEPGHRWSGRDGVQLAGDAWGDPHDPTVVLMHGGGQTRHAWKELGQVLARSGFRVLSYDARGHGDSDRAPDSDYSIDAMAADLAHVVETSEDPHPVLVGASMGGDAALLATADAVVSPSALILVDIAPRVELAGVRRIADFMEGPANGFGSLDEVADAISAYQPHRRATRNLKGLAKNVRVDDGGRYHWHWDPAFRPITDLGHLEQRRARLEGAARRLRVPTLLVRGGLSDIVSDEGAQEFLRFCPEADYVNVETAGHMVAGDDNDAFAATIFAFLARRTSGAAVEEGERPEWPAIS